MARAATGARNIVVNEVKYRWRASGTDDGISLVVWPHELAGACLSCLFDYDQTHVPKGGGRVSLTQQIVITARIVRRVIQHAIRESGYDPQKKGPEVRLGQLSKVVDLSDALRSE